MRKELVREVKFGRGIAKITVVMFTDNVSLDGDIVGQKVYDTTKIEVISNGKTIAESSCAYALEYNDYHHDLYEATGMDKTKAYTRVDKLVTEGKETAELIEKTIEEMKAELAREFGVKTEKEIETEEEIEIAQEVVALAEKQGIENLMTQAELASWRKRYNTIHNEGGEGYIPPRVSKEEYQKALEILQS